MPISSKIIKTKIGSVKSIAKITRAMELVSVAKMKPAVDRTTLSREYALRALEIIESLSMHQTLRHPLVSPGKGQRTLVVLVSSNKGLCGSYNANILRAFTDWKKVQKVSVDLIAVGKYSERVAKLEGVEVKARFVSTEKDPSWLDAKEIADLMIEKYKGGEYSRVLVFYTRYVSAMSYKPALVKVLPVSTSAAHEFEDTVGNMDTPKEEVITEGMDEYLFEPSEEELLDAVLPRLVESQVYQAMLEARASEHSARMFAMKSASDNAKSLIEDLTLSYNQARQSAITSEISEIAAGADALN